MCLTAKKTSDCKQKKTHLQTAGKDHYLGKRDGVQEKEREREREREREMGREYAVFYEKGG